MPMLTEKSQVTFDKVHTNWIRARVRFSLTGNVLLVQPMRCDGTIEADLKLTPSQCRRIAKLLREPKVMKRCIHNASGVQFQITNLMHNYWSKPTKKNPDAIRFNYRISRWRDTFDTKMPFATAQRLARLLDRAAMLITRRAERLKLERQRARLQKLAGKAAQTRYRG